ncbi:uncharacterized protein UBRO_21005 [Ustilago bromivora]|uniref:Secreted protein n=1 Tax=Ustilago bromivora TaxID=307758 RepID=A0A1K0G6K9_9BASI|nr:uncharacterized protein UBRO_21005 [Ustilago bromivora]
MCPVLSSLLLLLFLVEATKCDFIVDRGCSHFIRVARHTLFNLAPCSSLSTPDDSIHPPMLSSLLHRGLSPPHLGGKPLLSHTPPYESLPVTHGGAEPPAPVTFYCLRSPDP